MSKLISIIIPFYNSEKTISKTLESVFSQVTQNVEIICIDDCSTDSSLSIVKDCCYQNENVKIFSLPQNSGVSKARNFGLEHASGDFILFLDADDLLMNGIISFINQSVDFSGDLILFNYQTVSSQENLFLEINQPIEMVSLNVEECKDKIIGINSSSEIRTRLSSVWAKLFKRQIIEENNITFDTNITIGEDSLFIFEYCQFVESVQYFPIVSYLYYQNYSSLTHSFQSNMLINDRSWQSAFIKLLELYPNQIKSEKYVSFSLAKGIINTCYLYFGHKESSLNNNDKYIQLKLFVSSAPYQMLWTQREFKEIITYFSLKDRLLLNLLKRKQYRLVLFILTLKNIYK